MARPERNNVDYFPFYCEDGNKMFYIEETYGNDGFATFIKLLRELAKTNYHYLDLSKPTTIMFLSAKCKISKETLKAIINDLVDLGKFDKVLWEENQVIWCQDFVDSIQDAYLRRNNKCITYQGLLQHLISLGIRKPIKCTKKDSNNPQTKLEDTKLDEIKVNNIDERKLKFASTLTPFKSVYDNIELKKFYDYWTEPNKSNTKFRQEMEKTWSLERRLETWVNNNKKFNKNGNTEQPKSRLDKFFANKG